MTINEHEPLCLIFAGEGGQGAQTAASVLADAAFDSDLEALYLPNFGVEQRGGVSVAFLQLGKEPIACPKFQTAYLAVALAPRAVSRISSYCDNNTTIIYIGESEGLPQLPATSLVFDRGELKGERHAMVALGLAVALTEAVSPERVLAVIQRRFGLESNTQSFRRGLRLAEEVRR